MARFYAPSCIFIDEVDSIGTKRGGNDEGEASRRLKSELLIQMDGAASKNSANCDANSNEETKEKDNKMVIVLGATNRPWDLDEALIRRFEKRVYIPLPNEKGREELFKLNLQGVTTDNQINYQNLTELTSGYSGADIANVCREAALLQMRRRFKNNEEDIEELIDRTGFVEEIEAPISEADLKEALNNISKSVSNVDISNYEKWTENFQSV